jgi:hypothetical protein
MQPRAKHSTLTRQHWNAWLLPLSTVTRIELQRHSFLLKFGLPCFQTHAKQVEEMKRTHYFHTLAVLSVLPVARTCSLG